MHCGVTVQVLGLETSPLHVFLIKFFIIPLLIVQEVYGYLNRK